MKIENITHEECRKLMDKYNIGSLTTLLDSHGGYNAPIGIGYVEKDGNIMRPLFYFRRQNNSTQEEYEDYLKIFKYAFYN